MPDELDRQLADRLRAYESSVPADLEPGAARRRRPAFWAMAGAGTSVAAAAILGFALLSSDPDQVGNASPTPVPSTSASAIPTSTAPESAPPSIPAPSASPSTPASAAPSSTAGPPSGPIGRWAPTGAFASDGWAEETRDIAYAAGHFVAIGHREPDDTRGQVGGVVREPRIWTSPDGRSWEQLELGPEFTGAHLAAVVALPDGTAMIYGSVPVGEFDGTTAVWRSVDAVTWTRVDLVRPSHDGPAGVVAGGRGLLAVGAPDDRPGTTELWHSTDGITWRTVHSLPEFDGDQRVAVWRWEAGAEGFVVTGQRSPAEGGVEGSTSFVLASGDGVTWYEGEPELTPTPTSLLVAPVGGDWIVVGDRSPQGASTVEAWFSANGLAWERRGTATIPLPANPDGYDGIATFPAHLVSTGERVLLVGLTSVCCHGPAWAASVFSSFDGRTWERLGFPDGTVVTAAAEHDGIVVLAGFDRARPEDEFKARAMFWIGERD